jgi:hypothetical protein
MVWFCCLAYLVSLCISALVFLCISALVVLPQQALKNALRYFPAGEHALLAPEFLYELETYGHIYMYRFRPRCVRFLAPS